ncbi:unnamed protein product [Blepharisma stoltei]|uniref:RING-type domain-containing protein n=1 Tax=Blepharisma stoltei TaxID=1481888 RepID=A0AAU9JLH3_9CILI|nr:unnamed protein product [Blepharisma stoltei]
MNWFKKLNLILLFGMFILYDSVLLMYLMTEEFSIMILQRFCVSILILSFISNPILLILISAYRTELSSFNFSLRIYAFFPIAFIFCNTFLAMHPKVMKFLMFFMGLKDTREIYKLTLCVFFGKYYMTVFLELFIQSWVIAYNIIESKNFNFNAIIYVGTVILFSILLGVLRYFDANKIYRDYVIEYSIDNPDLDGRLIVETEESEIYPPSDGTGVAYKRISYDPKGDEKTCAVCLENLIKGDIALEINSCGHQFHENCLIKWFERRPICPLCRIQH